jgi:hypothetical protein
MKTLDIIIQGTRYRASPPIHTRIGGGFRFSIPRPLRRNIYPSVAPKHELQREIPPKPHGARLRPSSSPMWRVEHASTGTWPSLQRRNASAARSHKALSRQASMKRARRHRWSTASRNSVMPSDFEYRLLYAAPQGRTEGLTPSALVHHAQRICGSIISFSTSQPWPPHAGMPLDCSGRGHRE